MNQLENAERSTLNAQRRINEGLTVERVAGARLCVLSGWHDGREIERVTTLDPQMMVDYLDREYPGVIVRWLLHPASGALALRQDSGVVA